MVRDGNSDREGLFIRKKRNDYYCLPVQHGQEQSELLQVVKDLNPMVSAFHGSFSYV